MEKPKHFFSKDVFKSSYPLSHGTYYNVGDKTIVCLSGCIPADKEGKFVGGDAYTQTIATMENVKASLTEIGATFRDIIKVIIYVTDMSEVPEINRGYSAYFKDYDGYFPARCCFAVKALPLGGKLEIESTAVIPKTKF